MPHCHFNLGLSMCPGDRQTPGRQLQWAEHSEVVGSVYYAKSLFLTSFHIIITSVAFPSLTFSIDQRTQLKSNTLFLWAWFPLIKGFLSLQFSHSFFLQCFLQYFILSSLKFQWPNLELSVFLGRIRSTFTDVIRKSLCMENTLVTFSLLHRCMVEILFPLGRKSKSSQVLQCSIFTKGNTEKSVKRLHQT